MTILFWIAVLFTLTVPTAISILLDDTTTSWIALVSGAFVVLMSRIDNLAELSLGPLKAKLRARIEEATATIDQLRSVAVTSAEATLTDLISGSFMGGMTAERRLQLYDKIIESLRAIGADESQIEEAVSDWNKGIGIIYHRAIQDAVGRRLEPGKLNPAASDEMKAAERVLQDMLVFKTWTVPTPDEMRAVVDKHGVNSDDVRSWIDDYEHFLETGQIRRREEFVKH